MNRYKKKKLVSWEKGFIKKLFCKHDYKYYKDGNSLLASGEYQYLICSKCGKLKDKVFLEYEGMGFK